MPDGWRDLIHLEDMTSFVAEFARSLRAKRPFRSEVRVLDKSGHVRWLRADAVRRLDDVGHFLGYTGCAVDITETKVSQQQQTTLIHELIIG